MRFSPQVRKAALTVHVVGAVGWFGAVAGYLALAVAGLHSADPHLVRACYTAMALIGWWVIAPASAAALLTGILQALGTAWGLTRHWWVLLKLGMTLFAAAALLVHLHPTSLMAEVVKVRDLAPGELGGPRRQLVIAPTLALILLAFNAGLGVVKPSGLTPFGSARTPCAKHRSPTGTPRDHDLPRPAP